MGGVWRENAPLLQEIGRKHCREDPGGSGSARASHPRAGKTSEKRATHLAIPAGHRVVSFSSSPLLDATELPVPDLRLCWLVGGDFSPDERLGSPFTVWSWVVSGLPPDAVVRRLGGPFPSFVQGSR